MPASPRPSAWLWLCALGLLLSHAARPSLAAVFTNHWAVKVTGGTTEADRIASKYGYINLGQIGSLHDYYHFHHSRVMKRATVRSRGAHTFIEAEPQVEWVEQQVVRRRSKRDFKTVSVTTLLFNDPKWSSMWYLNCSDRGYNCRSDMNVMAAWRRGYTGRNVVVTILDDGIERNHPDLVDNYDPLASYDVNGDDLDPMPRYDISNENKHGTRCAGEVAATANNSICVSGVAYNARIGGVRMLDGEVTDMVEATALGVNPQHIDVYSASWGPDDDGRTVDGPATLARRALESGIRKGRGGLGSIYVWASGNGGRSRDHCSCDGYTNSIFTISISSSTESGKKPWYLEECASTLATTYSSGEAYDRKIITTDLRQKCTDGHTGTSASAPMAAGIIALALEANPGLTWRDVQHIVVKTSRSNNLHAPDWKTNGAGHRVSHLYGFGLMDAGAMVMEAEKWRPLPPQHVCVESAERSNRLIRSSQTLTAVHQATGCGENAAQRVVFLEHVVVRVTISHPRRGDLSVYLTSPSGTKSQLLAKRAFDNSQEGFKNWEFMTSHCWGERAAGTWTLEIHDNPSNYFRNPRVLGKLKEWSLILHGTAEPPYTWQGGAGGPAGKVERDRSPEPANPTEHAAAAAAAHDVEYEDYSEETEYSGLCHAECDSQGCDGPGEDQCMSCARWSLRLRGGGRKCLSECPIGFFGDGDTRRCRRCSRECRACSGAGLERCSECRTGYFRQEGPGPQCMAACSDGFYLDTAAMICRRCTESCERCVGAAERCTMCRNGLSLHGSMCVPKCQERTYFNLQETRCEPCHPSCNTCANGGQYSCLKCAAGYLRQDGICVPDCSPSYYREEVEEGAEPSCDKCEVSCVTCSGPTDRSCTSCSEGHNLEAGACVAVYTCRDSSGETVDTSFCYLVKVNNLCSRKVLQQLCCKTCSNRG